MGYCRSELHVRQGQRACSCRWPAIGRGRVLRTICWRPTARRSLRPTLPALTTAELQPIVNAAIDRWTSAGLDAATAAKLRQVQFAIGDLPGGTLGEEQANLIRLDSDAAGHGWFVDSTPGSDEEFASSAGSPQLQAVDPRAVDHIDLLTVVEHELGHVVGLADLDALADDVMSGVLGVGIRRDASHADAVLAS